MKYLLTEKLSSTVVCYMILKRLLKPWTDWEAYKTGLIDKNGKRIKRAKTSIERQSFDILDRMCWSLKRLVTKFIGDNKFVYLFSAAYLMKENASTILLQNHEKYKDELSDFDFNTQKKLYDYFSSLEKNNIISESKLDFETNLFKIKLKIENNIPDSIRYIFEEESCVMSDVATFTKPLEQKKKINKYTIQKRLTRIRKGKHNVKNNKE